VEERVMAAAETAAEEARTAVVREKVVAVAVHSTDSIRTVV